MINSGLADETTLNDTAGFYTAMTGSDGSKILNITRPDTHGTKTALTATLYSDATKKDSLDTIFTVVTSPDSSKAKMWGHMPETLTAADGTVFKRPLLIKELSSQTGRTAIFEDNENWALFTQTQANSTSNGCGTSYVPTQAGLLSLFDNHAGNTIKTVQGWPVVTRYLSSTPDNTGMEQRNYKAVDLGNTVDGVTGADGTASFTVRQDNTPGYKTPLTVTLTNNAAITATLDTIFTVPTSPNVATAYFWGHMVDTATVSGKTLHRPLLKSELPSGATAAGTPTVNNETWALAHVIDANKWDIAQQCDSMNNAPTTAELQTLHSGFSSLGWPSSISFPYLSTDKAGSFYCGIEEGAGTLNCGIQPAKTSGFATCFR